MANHKSAEKRARQNVKRHEHNRSQLSEVKTIIQKVRAAATKKDVSLAKEVLKAAIVKIDQGVTKGLFHWRNGARKVSRLTQMVNGLK